MTSTVTFNENASPKSTTAQCRYDNTKIECDIDKLEVNDATSGKQVTIYGVLTQTSPPEKIPERLTPLLGRYDAVLEILSDYQSTRNPPEKIASLAIITTPFGSCPQTRHIHITMRPLSPVDRDDAHQWTNECPDDVEVYSRSTFGDFGGVGGWLAPFWNFSKEIKDIEISADSCGVRKQGKPKRKLSCLLRVYRNDEHSLTFNIPSIEEFTRERSVSFDKTKTKDSETRRHLGDKVSEQSRETNRNIGKGIDEVKTTTGARDPNHSNNYHTQTFEQGVRNGDFSMSRTATRTTSTGIAGVGRGGENISYKESSKGNEELIFNIVEPELKIGVSLKRNGKEVDFTKNINELINLRTKLIKAFNDIDAWIPDIGWKVTTNLSIFTGEITGSWGNRFPKDAKVIERLVYVEPYFDLDFKLKILSYNLAMSFGVEFKSPEVLKWVGASVHVILQATGSISGEVAVNQKVESRTFEPIALTSNSTVNILAQGTVTVNDTTFEGKGGVTGGIQFDGKLTVSLRDSPTIEGEFYFVETYVYATFIDERGETKPKRFKQKIYEKKNIWSGKITR